MRRGWDGRLYHWGTETVYFENGQKARETTVFGKAYAWFCPNEYGDTESRYWREDGSELSCRDWLSYLHNEHYPERYQRENR